MNVVEEEGERRLFTIKFSHKGAIATVENIDACTTAKDLAETSAPQAFGIHTVQELKHFLRLDVFGEKHQDRTEDRLRGSGLVSRL